MIYLISLCDDRFVSTMLPLFQGVLAVVMHLARVAGKRQSRADLPSIGTVDWPRGGDIRENTA